MTDFNINERLKLDLNAKILATRIDYTYKEIKIKSIRCEDNLALIDPVFKVNLLKSLFVKNQEIFITLD